MHCLAFSYLKILNGWIGIGIGASQFEEREIEGDSVWVHV
jgi:hypothetical protein